MSEASDLPIQADQSYREKRTVPQYSFIAHVEVIEPASDTHIAGRVSEISRKGCYIDILITLPPGTLIQLKVLRDRGTFSTKGKIIYAQECMGMGVAFLEIADGELKTLDAWLAELAAWRFSFFLVGLFVAYRFGFRPVAATRRWLPRTRSLSSVQLRRAA